MRKHGIIGNAFLFAATIGLATPAPAPACTIADAVTPYLHRTLPAVPQGAIAARVEILPGTPSGHQVRIRARILSMLRGSYDGSTLLIEPRMLSSCDGIPTAGEKGIVVGRVVSSSPEALVIDPVRAPSRLDRQRSRRDRRPSPTNVGNGS